MRNQLGYIRPPTAQPPHVPAIAQRHGTPNLLPDTGVRLIIPYRGQALLCLTERELTMMKNFQLTFYDVLCTVVMVWESKNLEILPVGVELQAHVYQSIEYIWDEFEYVNWEDYHFLCELVFRVTLEMMFDLNTVLLPYYTTGLELDCNVEGMMGMDLVFYVGHA